MFKRSKRADNNMTQYYVVIGVFVAVCVVAVLYVLLNPKKSFAQMTVIDDSAILVHNGQSSGFQRGENSFFQVSSNLWLMIIYSIGHSQMLRHFLEIPFQTFLTFPLANPVRIQKKISFQRNLTGERSIPNVFKM